MVEQVDASSSSHPLGESVRELLLDRTHLLERLLLGAVVYEANPFACQN